MNVAELKELLRRLEDEDRIQDDTEVRIAEQPQYPLQSRIEGLATLRDAVEEDGAAREAEGDEPLTYEEVNEVDEILYICAGSQIADDPYANRHLWTASERY